VSAPISRSIKVDGIALHVTEAGHGRPIVLLHGFTGSARAMEGIASSLRDSYRTISIDLIGHGQSDAPADSASYTMSRCVGQVASILDELEVRDGHLIGYSMGGRVALALCAAQPKRVASALLIGAGAGIADPVARAARIRNDDELAERIESEGIPAFVESWITQPFQPKVWRIGPSAHAEMRRLKLANRAHALAASLRGMGAGAQPPVHDQLSSVHLPICLAVGEEDEKFRAVAEDLLRALPDARIETVPDADHAAHIDNPTAFLGMARRFFAEVDARKQPPQAASGADTVAGSESANPSWTRTP
jgi:2-succinyl-6-hydroxy-2,4-cyclohexadiene-1-carboxylate synthase